jgi:hypothetical protein
MDFLIFETSNTVLLFASKFRRTSNMRLYHFTQKKNLLSIAMRGLTPNVPGEPLMTRGEPVVWLTRRPSLAPTAADIAFMQEQNWSAAEREKFSQAVYIGTDTMLTVELSTAGRRLWKWRKWLQHVGAKVSALIMIPTTMTDWYIYFGTVAPHKIDLVPTAENMLPAFEHNLACAVKEGNAERIAKLRAERDQLKALPPDQLIELVVAS